jgi:cytochrome c peroxidase
MLEKLGLYGDFPSQDQGRFEVTGEEKDRKVFKVPQLRNIALTGPWYHNGSVDNLEEAVRVMARLQLEREMSDSEVKDITAFLQTLNGKEFGHPE